MGRGIAGLITMMVGPELVACSSEEPAKPKSPSLPELPKLRSNLDALGPLEAPNADGLRLPPGFTSRILATSNQAPLPGSDYLWHMAPDGGATFLQPDGGWVYVSNSEFPLVGGVGALRFDKEGVLIDAYSILKNTNVNCAGGATPWGTWLSCEEVGAGKVWECDPLGKREGVHRSALGIFKHEAAAVDPVRKVIYLTEDEGDGCFYRFVPKAYPSLASGTLEVMQVGSDDTVSWHALPDPTLEGSTPTRLQVAEATPFDGGEGIFYIDDVVYFSTKGDNRVWALDLETQKLGVIYDIATAQNPILKGVDNLTGTCCGDILVAEDGGDMEIVAILPDGSLKPVVQVDGHPSSEVTGPAFDPYGTRLYFSSQRGSDGNGVTYEVSGPFHLLA